MTADLLRRALPCYGLPDDTPLTLLIRSENETWRAGDIILRLHRQNYHTGAEIASELAWLTALQQVSGLRTARPLATTTGALVTDIAGRHVVAFAPIAAQELQLTDDLPRWFAPLGQITARLHAHARGWNPPPGFARKRWDIQTILGPKPHWGDWRNAPGLDPASHATLTRASTALIQSLAAYGTGPPVFGLIHADLRLTNLMADATGLWVIDFDDCGFGWWLYDLAAALSFHETDPRVPDLIARWCDGYASIGPLAASDRAMIPALILVRRILLTAWLASRADSDTATALGGPAFTTGTVLLADGYLTNGLPQFSG